MQILQHFYSELLLIALVCRGFSIPPWFLYVSMWVAGAESALQSAQPPPRCGSGVAILVLEVEELAREERVEFGVMGHRLL